MYVPPDWFISTSVDRILNPLLFMLAVLILNPLDKISIGDGLSSAAELFACKRLSDALYRSLAVSIIIHSEVADVHFSIRNLGRCPVYTKTPSDDPFPTYEPKLEYPTTGAKQ